MQTKRYIRQEFLNNIKPYAQNTLKEKSVLVLGAGGLGSPVLLYLAGAGIGKITIVDRDIINESNLNRQILYTYDTIGKPKAQTAAAYIKSFNPEISIEPLKEEITDILLDKLIPQHDLVFDCCDNHITRMQIAKSCSLHNAPCVVTGINKLEGFIFLSIPKKTACYGCLYGNTTPKTLTVQQVLGANAGVFGSLAASLGVLFLLGHIELNKMTLADLYSMSFQTILLNKNETCPICSINRTGNGAIDG